MKTQEETHEQLAKMMMSLIKGKWVIEASNSKTKVAPLENVNDGPPYPPGFTPSHMPQNDISTASAAYWSIYLPLCTPTCTKNLETNTICFKLEG